MDGLICGAVMGALLVAPVSPLGAPFGALFGAVAGAAVGLLLGVVVGGALALYATFRRWRGADAPAVAARLPGAVTLAVGFVVAIAAALSLDRLPGLATVSDVAAWLWMIAVVVFAIVLGRKSARSTARWYVDS